MAEGWYVAVSAQFFRYVQVPCCRVILKSGEIRRCAATRPRHTMILGFKRNVSYFRYGKHASFSASFGSRFPGGWHFKILVMYISSRDSPQSPKSLSKYSPERPTKGIPCWSSCPPGASATSMISAWRLPRPMTGRRLVWHNGHWVQAAICCSMSFHVYCIKITYPFRFT